MPLGMGTLGSGWSTTPEMGQCRRCGSPWLQANEPGGGQRGFQLHASPDRGHGRREPGQHQHRAQYGECGPGRPGQKRGSCREWGSCGLGAPWQGGCRLRASHLPAPISAVQWSWGSPAQAAGGRLPWNWGAASTRGAGSRQPQACRPYPGGHVTSALLGGEEQGRAPSSGSVSSAGQDQLLQWEDQDTPVTKSRLPLLSCSSSAPCRPGTACRVLAAPISAARPCRPPALCFPRPE